MSKLATWYRAIAEVTPLPSNPLAGAAWLLVPVMVGQYLYGQHWKGQSERLQDQLSRISSDSDVIVLQQENDALRQNNELLRLEQATRQQEINDLKVVKDREKAAKHEARRKLNELQATQGTWLNSAIPEPVYMVLRYPTESPGSGQGSSDSGQSDRPGHSPRDFGAIFGEGYTDPFESGPSPSLPGQPVRAEGVQLQVGGDQETLGEFQEFCEQVRRDGLKPGLLTWNGKQIDWPCPLG